jgi:hypothetical protein
MATSNDAPPTCRASNAHRPHGPMATHGRHEDGRAQRYRTPHESMGGDALHSTRLMTTASRMESSGPQPERGGAQEPRGSSSNRRRAETEGWNRTTAWSVTAS